MDDIVVKTCVSCNIEKRFEYFYKKIPEGTACNMERTLKR